MAPVVIEDDPVALRRYRRGDAQMLGDLYDAHLEAVAGFLRRGFSVNAANGPVWVGGVASTFELEEICQEVFVRAFSETARRRYDGVRPFKTFLLTIARNLRIDRHRRDRLRLADAVEQPVEPRAHALLDRHELDQLVERFVEELAEPEGAYYRLRYRDGLSQSAAALRLGLGRTPARALEAQIKRRLFAYLHRHGYAR